MFFRDRFRFDEIVNALPTYDGRLRHPIQPGRPDVTYVAASLKQFVGPDLRVRPDIGGDLSAPVQIVSAPGAVGKSTVAQEIAARIGAPLWDLAKARTVGQGSVEGMFAEAFGRGINAQQVREALVSGSLVLLVDALDEIKIKVTDEAFDDFLRDLSALAVGGKGPKVVLLGRTQIAETAWLLLEGHGVRTNLLQIEPFSDDQIAEYLEKRIPMVDEEAGRSMKQNPGPFADARDLLLSKLKQAVGGKNSTVELGLDERAFIGYAPVLDAVARRLAAQPNWAVQKQEIESSIGIGTENENQGAHFLLQSVVEAILVREQERKLIENFKQAAAQDAERAGWSGWESLYSPTEQAVRVLARVLGMAVPEAPRTEAPKVVAERYERSLAQWLPEHPFLQDGRTFVNAVFESYLFSRALVENLGGLRDAVESRLRDPAHLPTRLLAEFYLTAASREGTPFVQAEHVGWLYDSILAGESSDSRVSFSLDGPDPEDFEFQKVAAEVDGEFVLNLAGTPHRIEFKTLARPDSEFAFERYLKHATIQTAGRVRLGAAGEEYQIGPQVQINCSELIIGARSVVVGGVVLPEELEESGVELAAISAQTNVSRKPRVHTSLRVSWPNAAAFPWSDHAASARPGESVPEELREAYRRFRRIVMTLRSHKKGSLARYEDKVRHQRVLQGRLGEALLEMLLEDGILRLSGNFFHWEPKNAARLVGIDWHRLRAGESSLQLQNYLTSLLERMKGG